MKIVINQVGFAPEAAKHAVLISEGPVKARGFVVEDESGAEALTGELGAVTSLWGSQVCSIDLSALSHHGAYRVRVGDTCSPVFRIGPNEPGMSTLHAATEFFFIQRCGMEVPGWHAACHLDDGQLPDGTFRDATGGWHDAGDYNKYNGYTPLSVVSLLLARRTAPDCFDRQIRNGRSAAVDEAEWGALWIAKMVDPETGRLWRDIFSGYRFWGKPEDETDNVPESGDERKFRAEPTEGHQHEMGAAAFAYLAEALPEAGEWRTRAEALWEVSDAMTTDVPVKIASAVIAALALYRITKDARYEEAAAKLALRLVTDQREDGLFAKPEIVDYGLPAAAIALTALEFKPLRGHFMGPLLRYLEACLALSDNPYRILKFDAENYFFNYENPDAWYVGQDSMYLSQAWAAALIWVLTGDERARDHSQDQVDWILGKNPYGLCLMDGVGTDHTPLYHHRYDALPGHNTGAVPGAVVNGIARKSPEEDEPAYDLKTEGRARYQTNEPWLPHNAYYLLAVATLCYSERD